MWSAQSDSRLLAAVLVALIAVAWVALFLWGLSPYDYALRHEALAHTEIYLDWRFLARGAVFATGWALMTIAMMLPTSLPLVLLFRTFTQRRANRNLLTAILLVGYVLIWLAFGLLAHSGDLVIHRLIESSAALHNHAWLLGASTVLMAGVYQFTPLKYVCLDKCRSPFSFIVEQWRGTRYLTQSFRIGVSHGIFCVGCCWPLMLLMFALGTGNLAWMLVLAAVMGVEKNFSWGRRLSMPLGVVLLSAGMTMVALETAAT